MLNVGTRIGGALLERLDELSSFRLSSSGASLNVIRVMGIDVLGGLL